MNLWLPPGYESQLARSAPAVPDLAPFVRANLSLGSLQGTVNVLEGWALEQAMRGVDPRTVPLSALQSMGTHPIVYLAERAIGGIVRRPDLYYVRHSDKRVVRETEAWLWPLLPRLLAGAARAFAYGAVPVVLDWTREDLRIEVPRDAGGVRNKTLFAHTHFAAAHELWPGDVEIEVEGDELVALRYADRRWAADRVCLYVWDPEFGGWTGQGARRRAWRDYLSSLLVGLLHTRYLDRSVDSPRVMWAPQGTYTVEGREVSILEYVVGLLQTLKGSGAVSFPSARDAGGNKRFELETLDLPDRKDVWEQALNRFDGGILKAYLVPPSLAGVEDLAATGAKILDGMLKEFIQDLAQFAANHLTALVKTVHAVNHDPQRVAPPEVLAYEVPAAIRKLYLEVLRLVGAANRGESPSAWVDVPALLDQLGVPIRTAPLEDAEPAGVPPGRPPDLTGERQERREDARTVEQEHIAEGEDEGGGP